MRQPKISGRHYSAKVSFRGRFPVDMLRYDRCYPSTERDAGLIQASIESGLANWVPMVNAAGTPGLAPGAADAEVSITKFSTDPGRVWNPDRWRSFGCNLMPEAFSA